MKSSLCFKISFIIISMSIAILASSVRDTCDRKIAENNCNSNSTVDNKQLYKYLNSCISLNGISLTKCACKDTCKKLDETFIDYVFGIVQSDSIHIFYRVRALYILAMNGTIKSLDYVKSVIIREPGCLSYAGIASLHWFSGDLTTNFLKELASATTDPRTLSIIYPIINSYKNVNNIDFFRNELNKKEQSFYIDNYDCEYYFNNPEGPIIVPRSLKEILWACISDVCGKEFKENIDSLDNWIKQNR